MASERVTLTITDSDDESAMSRCRARTGWCGRTSESRRRNWPSTCSSSRIPSSRPTATVRCRSSASVTASVRRTDRAPRASSRRIRPRGRPTSSTPSPSRTTATTTASADRAQPCECDRLGRADEHDRVPPLGVSGHRCRQPVELRIDLDPQPGTDFADAVTAAHTLREVLREAGLEAFRQDQWQPRSACLRADRTDPRVPGCAACRDRGRTRAGAAVAGTGHHTNWWKEERGERIFESTSTRPTATVRWPVPTARAHCRGRRCPLPSSGRARRPGPADVHGAQHPEPPGAGRRPVGDDAGFPGPHRHPAGVVGSRDKENGLGELPFPPEFPEDAGGSRPACSRARRSPRTGTTTVLPPRRTDLAGRAFSYNTIDMISRETINGSPVTEEQIAAWSAEAEAGYDAEVLKKRGRGRPDAERHHRKSWRCGLLSTRSRRSTPVRNAKAKLDPR